MGRAFEFRKERKFKRWAAMSKTFTKIGKEIVIAVKEGGPDPDTNSRLRAIIQNAKAANMPKDNIERAIKRAVSKDQANYDEVIFEGYGPHGIAILVETATDNNTRTVANVRSCFSHNNGSLGTSGSVAFLFEHKCHFDLPKDGLNLEELELELIDYGADEIFEEDDKLIIYADFKDYGSLQQALEVRNIEVANSGFEYLPLNTQKLPDDQREEVEKLLEKLEEDDDVQNVWSTLE